MRIIIHSIGKTKHPALATLEIEYAKRIRQFHSIGFEYHRTEQKLVEALQGVTTPCIALDEFGKEYTSVEFSKWLGIQEQSYGTCVFVLGDSPGLSENIKKMCQQKIALSKMTFTHEFARVLLLEQVYRAVTIQRGHPYHK